MNSPESQKAARSKTSCNSELPLASELRQQIEGSELPVVLAITAEWCGICHIMTPVLHELSEEWHQSIQLLKVNIEANEEIARAFGVTELPFLLFFANSRLVDHTIGLISKSELSERIEALSKSE